MGFAGPFFLLHAYSRLSFDFLPIEPLPIESLPVQLLLSCAIGYGAEISVQGTITIDSGRLPYVQGGSTQVTKLVSQLLPASPPQRPLVVRPSPSERPYEDQPIDTSELPVANQEDFCVVYTSYAKGHQVVADGISYCFYIITITDLTIEDVLFISCVKGHDSPVIKWLLKTSHYQFYSALLIMWLTMAKRTVTSSLQLEDVTHLVR